jgi:hypothetical protein
MLVRKWAILKDLLILLPRRHRQRMWDLAIKLICTDILLMEQTISLLRIPNDYRRSKPTYHLVNLVRHRRNNVFVAWTVCI